MAGHGGTIRRWNSLKRLAVRQMHRQMWLQNRTNWQSSRAPDLRSWSKTEETEASSKRVLQIQGIKHRPEGMEPTHATLQSKEEASSERE